MPRPITITLFLIWGGGGGGGGNLERFVVARVIT